MTVLWRAPRAPYHVYTTDNPGNRIILQHVIGVAQIGSSESTPLEVAL
jgi:hypothetical protein